MFGLVRAMPLSQEDIARGVKLLDPDLVWLLGVQHKVDPEIQAMCGIAGFSSQAMIREMGETRAEILDTIKTAIGINEDSPEHKRAQIQLLCVQKAMLLPLM